MLFSNIHGKDLTEVYHFYNLSRFYEKEMLFLQLDHYYHRQDSQQKWKQMEKE